MVRIFYYFFLSLPSPFLPVAPLSPQLVLTFFISSRCKLQFLHSPSTQAPAQRRQHRLISSFSTPISILSHFSSTLSLNHSPSQTPRPMITGVGFWFCCRDWQNNVVAVTEFYVDGFYFYFDEWVLILLMVDGWWMGFVDGWWMMAGFLWLMNGGGGGGGCGWW